MPSARVLAADLAATVSDLDGYIERRAQALAAPIVAALREEADERVAEARGAVQRLEDVVTELRCRLAAADRNLERWHAATGCRSAAEWRQRDDEPCPRFTCEHQASNFTPCRQGCHRDQDIAAGEPAVR